MKRIAILLVVVALTACGQIGNKSAKTDSSIPVVKATPAPADWATYTHENYSIKYPNDWKFQENYMGTDFIIFSPADSTSPTFTENINMTKEDLDGKSGDLDKLIPPTLDMIKRMATNFNLVSSTKKKDGQGEYQEIIYTANQGNYAFQQEQWYRVFNNKVYVLTLTLLRKNWDQGRQIGEQSIGTFSIK